MADKEIGTEPITEVLTFNVSDSSGNILPNQILSVVIEPVDNRAPAVFVGSTVQVLCCIIDLHFHSAFDSGFLSIISQVILINKNC
jgi:hypothetical protein